MGYKEADVIFFYNGPVGMLLHSNVLPIKNSLYTRRLTTVKLGRSDLSDLLGITLDFSCYTTQMLLSIT